MDPNYHNKGQEDYAAGIYDPPHDLIDQLTSWFPSDIEREGEENAAYDAGQSHARGQDRG